VKIDTAEAKDWRELREFAAVDIDKSFIISWHLEAGSLMIDVDLFLTVEHPSYEEPRPAEKVCIRTAIIEFPYCEKVSVEDDKSFSMTDLVEDLGHGVIEGLRRHADGRYEINGEFGTVFIAAERPLVRLKGP